VSLSVQELPDTLNGEALRDKPAAPPPLRKVSGRRYAGYLLFTLCSAIYLLPFMRLFLRGTDEGTLVYGAVRIVHGQVFARDFFEVMGPGTFYWLAAFFKLFGETFAAERLCLFVTSLGTGLLMYYLSRRVCQRYQILPFALLIGTSFSTLWPLVSHHADSNVFALLSVACLVLWHDTRRDTLLLAAGAMAAATTCILQPKGLLLFIAMLLWLLMQRWRHAARLSALGLIIGGYCAVIGLVLLYFWSKSALRDLVYANYIWPSQHYGAVNAVPYAQGIFQYWSHWTVPVNGTRWLIGLAAVVILPFLVVTTLPALILVFSLRHHIKKFRPVVLLYWLCGWALWFSEIHRKDIGHLVAGSPLLIILCVYFLTEYRGKIADTALQILTISAGTLAAVNLLMVMTARPVPTRAGSVAMFQPDPVIGFLDEHTAPGEEIFAYPYCPKYYFLTATTNPTRYSLLVYNYNTPAEFNDAIRALDQHKVRYVIWDTHSEALASFFPASARVPSGDQLMEPYLQSHYRQVKLLDGVRIMERNDENPSN
jgi:hypothetical protein